MDRVSNVVSIVASLFLIAAISVWLSKNVDCGKIPLVGTYCVTH
jgi:hypothetical protein